MADDDEEEAQRVLKTVTDLVSRMKGRTLNTPRDPAYKLAHERFGRDLHARGEVLAQAIELVTPIIEADMRPVVEQCAGATGVEWAPKGAPWLEGKGLCIASAARPTLVRTSLEMFDEQLFLLDDGRLGAIAWLSNAQTGNRSLTILRASLLEPSDALLTWDLANLLEGLDQAIGTAQGPEAEARREQLRALVTRAAEALLASSEGLEAAVRPV